MQNYCLKTENEAIGRLEKAKINMGFLEQDKKKHGQRLQKLNELQQSYIKKIDEIRAAEQQILQNPFSSQH